MLPDVSIVIPTFNEIDNIKLCISGIEDTFKKSNVDYEILVVDDNSTDGTYGYVKNASKKNRRIRVFSRKNERGLGSAIFFGLKKAEGKYLIPFMSDLSDDPEDAKKLYFKIKEGYDIVFTNRFKGKNMAYGYPKIKYFFNRAYNNLVSFVFGIPFRDSSNAFKAFKKDVIDKIEIKYSGFEVTTELAVKAFFNGKKFAEIPITWQKREKGTKKSNLLKIAKGYFGVMILLLREKFRRKFK